MLIVRYQTNFHSQLHNLWNSIAYRRMTTNIFVYLTKRYSEIRLHKGRVENFCSTVGNVRSGLTWVGSAEFVKSDP